jgi:hypothetical protein
VTLAVPVPAASAVTGADDGVPPPPRPTPSRWVHPAVVVFFGLCALGAYLPVWPGESSRLPWCACGDPAQAVWYLAWVPYALAHGHNVLVTNWIDYPHGVNLSQNTSMPLLGLLAAPITELFGPVAAYTALLWLGLTASATAAYFVTLRFVRWWPAAALAGLLYGFSSYMAGQALGHLNLTFVPVPPVLLYVLYRICVDRSPAHWRWGVALGLLGVVQFFISPEVLVDTGIVALIALVLAAAAHARQLGTHLRRVASPLGWAALVAVPLLAYPAYLYLHGPEHFTGSPWHGVTYAEDLLGSIVPSLNQRITPFGLAAVGTRLQADLAENGAYLGLPLLVLLVFLVVRYRRLGLVRLTAAVAVAAWLLSLGSRLTVDGHVTAVRLPFAVLEHLPVVDSILAGRFTLFVGLFAAWVLALGLDELRLDLASKRQAVPAAVSWLVAGLALVALLPLLPRWPNPSVAVDSPDLFTSPALASVPAGSVMLTYPYPQYPANQAMLWQAQAAMRFKLLGGYALVPGAGGQATNQPEPVDPDDVPATLIYHYLGEPVVGPTATPADVRALVRRYHVATVVAQRVGGDPAAAVALFTAAFGPPRRLGGLDVWRTGH